MTPSMRFDTSQKMKLGQQMKLAPRMIQSMEILQMPLAELEERLEEELGSNPTLELVEGEPDDAPAQETPDTSDGELDAGTEADDFARLDRYAEDNPDAAGNDFDDGAASREVIDWRHEAPRSGSRLDGEPDARHEMLQSAPTRGESLQSQLLNQWSMVEVDPALRAAGEAIIGFIDDDGYMRADLEEVADKAPTPSSADPGGWPPDAETMDLALRAVQLLLEPAGVGARDAQECLLLQIDAQLDLAEPAGALSAARNGTANENGAVAPAGVLLAARRLIADHFEDLLKNRLPKIAENSGLTLEQIREGIDAVRRLSLAPGKRVAAGRAEPITPDAIVEYDEANDRYVAYLNDRRLPNLRINREYAMMSRDRELERNDREFLKKNLSNATWLLDAVEQRRSTLLRVINAVLAEQREYFDVGPEAMRPLPMTQVAERLGLHVATVSRAVSDKHLLTPRGVVPLRGFFTGGLSTEGGGEMSYDAVRAALKEVVDAEDKSSPLSDEAIVKALKERGVEIARRTVAKYRGQLDIPSARMRRQYN